MPPETGKLHTTVFVSLVVSALALASMACGGTNTGAPPQAAGTPSSVTVGHNVGDRAPDFTITISNGQAVRLASLLEQRRPVVLYFFTTW